MTRRYFHIRQCICPAGSRLYSWFLDVLWKHNGLNHYEQRSGDHFEAAFAEKEEAEEETENAFSHWSARDRTTSKATLRPARLNSVTSQKHFRKKRQSILTKKMLEERSQRATLNYQQLVKKGLAPKDMNDENINAVWGFKLPLLSFVEYLNTLAYWELYLVLLRQFNAIVSEVTLCRNAMRWSTTNESMLRVHACH